MTTIQIEEYTNAYGVVVFDGTRYVIKETVEDKAQALQKIRQWTADELAKELKIRQQYAGEGAI